MAKEAEAPDGTILEFPDDTPDDVVDNKMREYIRGLKGQGAAPTRPAADVPDQYMAKLPQTDTLGGLAGQFGSGLVEGVAMIPGLPRDLAQLELMGLDYLGGVEKPTEFPLPMASGQMMKDIVGSTGLLADEPTTGLGQGFRTSGQFTGGNVALGGVNIPSVARGIGAGVGSEWAGQTFPDEPLAPFAGAFFGGGLPSKVGNVVPGANMTRDTVELANKLKALGVDVFPGQMGGRGAKLAYDVPSSLPLMPRGAEENQIRQFNSALARQMGTQADNLGPDVMSATRNRLSGEFDTVLNRNRVDFDPTLKQELDDILIKAGENLGETGLKDVENALRNIKNSAQRNLGSMPGRLFQNLTREGGSIRGLIKNADSQVRYYGKQVRDAMDRALERHATAAGRPNDAQALRKTKKQWQVMKQLEPLAAKAAEGAVSPAQLLGRVAASDKNLAYSDDALATLARGGQRFLKPLPSSTTAERTMVMDAAKGAAALVPAAAAGAATMSLLPVAGTAIATYGGLRGMKGALESKGLAAFMKAAATFKDKNKKLFEARNRKLRQYGLPYQVTQPQQEQQ